MKERPILFSSAMVRAILAGKKTQTRRILKRQPHGAGEWVLRGISWMFPNVCPYIAIKCPYGQPGDRLWVRETWYDCIDNNDIPRYAADGPAPITENRHYKKRPSIFMPHLMSRITLEIINIKIERLQDISERDALAEGVYSAVVTDENHVAPSECFKKLWESINGAGSWKANPWVWVIEFKKL
jgi:hypothetical protein